MVNMTPVAHQLTGEYATNTKGTQLDLSEPADDFENNKLYMSNHGNINNGLMNMYLNAARFVDRWLGEILNMLDKDRYSERDSSRCRRRPWPSLRRK